jgi:hypothetical protein
VVAQATVAAADSKEEATKKPTNTQKGQDKARNAEATKVRFQEGTSPYPLIVHVLFVSLGH